VADERLDLVRFIGDATIAGFFAADKDKVREGKRVELAERLTNYLANGDVSQSSIAEVVALRSGQFPVMPFHWGIEYPEVFDRENPGFDAIVGNPPYAGKNTLINGNLEGYLDWLANLHDESHGNADLVAHFFRRAFTLLRRGGCFGLIATKTIRQGDTRATGLRWICTHDGTIFAARRRLKWPGQAAVVVSVVWVAKGSPPVLFELDDRIVSQITAYLFHGGGNENPSPLFANARKSFVGSYPLGMGFTFDDTDAKGVANSLAEMHRLIAKDVRNADRIFPYIGGDELNESPTHQHHRYIIDFFDRSLEEASKWPDLIEIVRQRVKPERDHQKRDANRERWWQYAEKRPGLYAAIQGAPRVLAMGQTSKYRALTFLPTAMVYDQKIIVFPISTFASFAAMQSRFHDAWALFFGSSMKDDPVYTPSDCFETFPFPIGWETDAELELAGREYFEHRAALMVRNNEGLTKTYNRFHDPEETAQDILCLRELHAAMDTVVLRTYGWADLLPKCQCDFILDYEDEEVTEESTGRKKKKPWRYRWTDEVRDEVLARLLKLNAERAAEERLSNEAATSTARKSGKLGPKGRKSITRTAADGLFGTRDT